MPAFPSDLRANLSARSSTSYIIAPLVCLSTPLRPPSSRSEQMPLPVLLPSLSLKIEHYCSEFTSDLPLPPLDLPQDHNRVNRLFPLPSVAFPTPTPSRIPRCSSLPPIQRATELDFQIDTSWCMGCSRQILPKRSCTPLPQQLQSRLVKPRVKRRRGILSEPLRLPSSPTYHPSSPLVPQVLRQYSGTVVDIRSDPILFCLFMSCSPVDLFKQRNLRPRLLRLLT